ncbi:MAG: hypothetical protein GC192_22845 [Bacteroidetes bacterium]|nr:hypothetical protein [Bacteroidota bacterium]
MSATKIPVRWQSAIGGDLLCTAYSNLFSPKPLMKTPILHAKKKIPHSGKAAGGTAGIPAY